MNQFEGGYKGSGGHAADAEGEAKRTELAALDRQIQVLQQQVDAKRLQFKSGGGDEEIKLLSLIRRRRKLLGIE
ncbi:hypothetical protein HY933_03570 [Candidatus Falkowbacteria bacterium]|nr:hypothetical protein [Candidatus Falkowbacteria bacterium]